MTISMINYLCTQVFLEQELLVETLLQILYIAIDVCIIQQINVILTKMEKGSRSSTQGSSLKQPPTGATAE